jgi:hypothetical protein
MGLLSALGITNKNQNVQAQYAPAVMGDNTIPIWLQHIWIWPNGSNTGYTSTSRLIDA